MLIYKFADATTWTNALATGCFTGSSDDVRDGFVHLSSGAQTPDTLAKHFARRTDLIVAAVDPAKLGTSLKWEASRGGQLFPHIYGSLEMSDVVWAKTLAWNGTKHEFPPEAV